VSAKLGEHLLRTRPLAGAELVRRTPQRLVKTGPVCVVKAFALVCWDELNLRPSLKGLSGRYRLFGVRWAVHS